MLFSEASSIVNPTKYWEPNNKYISTKPLIYVSNSYTETGESRSLGSQIRLFSVHQTQAMRFRPLFFPNSRGKTDYQFAIISRDVPIPMGSLDQIILGLTGNPEEEFEDIQIIPVPEVFNITIKANKEDWMPFLSQEVHKKVHAVAREYAENFAIEHRLGSVCDLIDDIVIPTKDTPTYKTGHERLMSMVNLRTNS